MPGFLGSLVKPARACQWASGTFLCDPTASEERNQSPAQVRGPSFSLGWAWGGVKLFPCIISMVPNLPGSPEDAQFVAHTCRPHERVQCSVPVDLRKHHHKVDREFWDAPPCIGILFIVTAPMYIGKNGCASLSGEHEFTVWTMGLRCPWKRRPFAAIPWPPLTLVCVTALIFTSVLTKSLKAGPATPFSRSGSGSSTRLNELSTGQPRGESGSNLDL